MDEPTTIHQVCRTLLVWTTRREPRILGGIQSNFVWTCYVPGTAIFVLEEPWALLSGGFSASEEPLPPSQHAVPGATATTDPIGSRPKIPDIFFLLPAFLRQPGNKRTVDPAAALCLDPHTLARIFCSSTRRSEISPPPCASTVQVPAPGPGMLPFEHSNICFISLSLRPDLSFFSPFLFSSFSGTPGLIMRVTIHSLFVITTCPRCISIYSQSGHQLHLISALSIPFLSTRCTRPYVCCSSCAAFCFVPIDERISFNCTDMA